jgi:predicted XRE-type DNA-binding protein
MNAKLKTTKSSGNVFLDVGFAPDEANNLMLRAQLMSRVRDAARGASQREAAKRFGITQPRLNDVLRGRID